MMRFTFSPHHSPMKYLNGDQYVGEVYKGKRHGFGIYYYADGDFWFGEYNNDVRVGYGALYTVGDGMFIGEWRGLSVADFFQKCGYECSQGSNLY